MNIICDLVCFLQLQLHLLQDNRQRRTQDEVGHESKNTNRENVHLIHVVNLICLTPPLAPQPRPSPRMARPPKPPPPSPAPRASGRERRVIMHHLITRDYVRFMTTFSCRSPITPTKTFNERVQSSVKG